MPEKKSKFWLAMSTLPLLFRPDFLLVDLRDFSFRFRVGEEKGGKALKMSSQLVIFRAFFNISRTNSETSKIKQQSVLNL